MISVDFFNKRSTNVVNGSVPHTMVRRRIKNDLTFVRCKIGIIFMDLVEYFFTQNNFMGPENDVF